MTLTEFCLLTITLSMVAIAVGLIIVVTRVLPTLAASQKMTEEVAVAAKSLDGAIVELTGVLKDIRSTQTRVNGIVTTVLDQVEPPLRKVTAILSGIKTGVDAFTRKK